MLVSNCCGDHGLGIYHRRKVHGGDDDITTYKDVELCGRCSEHCEYVSEDDFNDTEQLKAMMKDIQANYPNLDHVNPEYRKYHGQIKPNDND